MTTTQMLTLTDFLLARIADDEAEWWPVCAGPRRNGKTHARRHLAECDAKRRIVEAAKSAGPTDAWESDYAQALEYVLRLLALPYATHPDYRPEWRA